MSAPLFIGVGGVRAWEGGGLDERRRRRSLGGQQLIPYGLDSSSNSESSDEGGAASMATLVDIVNRGPDRCTTHAPTGRGRLLLMSGGRPLFDMPWRTHSSDEELWAPTPGPVRQTISRRPPPWMKRVRGQVSNPSTAVSTPLVVVIDEDDNVVKRDRTWGASCELRRTCQK